MKKKIVCVVGTRPEAIKMAPVITALTRSSWAEPMVLATAQHRQMLDATLKSFQIQADIDLDIMRPDQGLSQLTARLIQGMDRIWEGQRPDMVLAQGDTSTVFAAALTSFYRRIPFGHVEAGLRTGNMLEPFPEEANRVFVGRIADLHFAPTSKAAENLRSEGVAGASIHVTGNTVIDALHWMAAQNPRLAHPVNEGRRLVLVTAHRRENFGAPFEAVLGAIAEIVNTYPDIEILYPVHPNPNAAEPAHRILGRMERVHLVPPLDYPQLIAAMQRAHLILTDSGGIQEEAPALGKPVLVLRAVTERPEAIATGGVRLVGTDRNEILTQSRRLLDDPAAYAAMAVGRSPYGDGHAAERILTILEQFLLG